MALAVIGAVLVFVILRLIRIEAELRRITGTTHGDTVNTRSIH